MEVICSRCNRPCADCGGMFPAPIMHFHHERDKQFNIGQMTYFPEAKIKTEIEKCVVLCANCHGIRTWVLDESLEE